MKRGYRKRSNRPRRRSRTASLIVEVDKNLSVTITGLEDLASKAAETIINDLNVAGMKVANDAKVAGEKMVSDLKAAEAQAINDVKAAEQSRQKAEDELRVVLL